MNRLIILIKGELSRLHKYNFTSISFLVAIIWGAILYFLDDARLSMILPFVLMLDATLMAVMYVGAVMYFEKNESTISTLLVTPITNGELILSKVISYTIHNLFSAALIIIAFELIRDIDINYPLLILGIVLATTFHTIAGICLSYFQKDFTGMLVQIMLISFALLIPTALMQFGVLTGDIWEVIAYINPINGAQTLIAGGFNGYDHDFDYFFSLGYLLIGSILLFKLFALPKFQDYAIKQSGV
jgi:fluoroquinolone transport system permease protein